MKYNIKYNEETAICTIEVSGKVRRPDDSMKLMSVVFKVKDKQGSTMFLLDMRKATIISSTITTFETGIAPQARGIIQEDISVALIYSGDLTEHKFMETVLINRGYNIRVTDRMEEAMKWLISES
jgi:hypothetical protein